jgi:hypothetical protein
MQAPQDLLVGDINTFVICFNQSILHQLVACGLHAFAMASATCLLMSLRIARLLAAGQAAATIAIMVDGSCLSTAEMEIVALHVARVVLLLGGGQRGASAHWGCWSCTSGLRLSSRRSTANRTMS